MTDETNWFDEHNTLKETLDILEWDLTPTYLVQNTLKHSTIYSLY